MKIFSYVKNFAIGFAISFSLAIISSCIASMFTEYSPTDLINIHGDVIVGPFILFFPIYYVYKNSKDKIKPNSKINNKYILIGTILVLSFVMVVFSHSHTQKYAGRSVQAVDIKNGKKIITNNGKVLFTLPESNLPEGYIEEIDICEYRVVFPCKVKETQFEANDRNYRSYQSVAAKGIPFLKAECLPIKLKNDMNTELFIKSLLKKYAKQNNIKIREIKYEETTIGEIGRMIGTMTRAEIQMIWVNQLTVGGESILIQYATELKTKFPSAKLLTFFNAVSTNSK